MAGFSGAWRAGLMPGSFRGVPFLCRDTGNNAGRRTADFEFPDSDSVYVQNLGRAIKRYKLEVYVCGDDYMAQRIALEGALDADGAATLVHPYKGPLQVHAKDCELSELWEKGRAAYFRCHFVEAGGGAPPLAAPDTAGVSFNAAQVVLPLLARAYIAAFIYGGATALVQSAAVAALAIVGSTISGALTAPGAAAAALSVDLPALLTVASDDQSGYAAQLATVMQDYVSGIVTDATAAKTAAPDATLGAGYQDWSRLPAMPGDPSFGLATLAGMTAASVTPGSPTGQAAENAAGLAQLVAGTAAAALAQLYSQSDFASQEDADAARTQIQQLVVGQIEAAAGNDLLVAAWRGALTAAVTDLSTRGANLPDVATYNGAAPSPAVVLAQRLYRDGSQAAALVQRNAAPHPLFMPRSVEYLEVA